MVGFYSEYKRKMQRCHLRINAPFVRFLALTVLALASYKWHLIWSDDPYARPFCDASGKCGEKPDIPSPRTVFSARSKEQAGVWWQAHATLNRSAEEYVTRRQRVAPDTLPPLILLGDSITESWIGTDMGTQKDRAKGVPAVLTDFFQQDYDPLVLAIGGDQTQHVSELTVFLSVSVSASAYVRLVDSMDSNILNSSCVRHLILFVVAPI